MREYDITPMRSMKDSLYSEILYSDEDLRLFQTPELTRLRRVSLSAVAPWLLPTSTPATKFEHSVGVGHLAKKVGRKPEFQEVAKDLYFAALAHDLGTPPFSHTSEHFQRALFGLDHEQFIDVVMENSAFAKEIKRQGGSPERVARFVKGEEKPWSDIINGSIDIDNLDNSLRWATSTGVIQQKTYSPEKLAESYSMRDGNLALQGDISKELAGWEQVRVNTYNFIYSPANLSPAVMLWQAMYFASLAGELTKDYFLMTDPEAFIHLEFCNKRTQTILERAKTWQFYERAFNYATKTPSDEMTIVVKDSMNRGVLGQELSDALHIEPTDVCVYVGKDKGFKQIHLPIIDSKADERMHTPANGLTWMVQVYVQPDVMRKAGAIDEFMQDRLATAA